MDTVALMLVLHVTIQVKPEHVSEFMEVVRYDPEHSETDEKVQRWLAAPPERRFGKNLVPSDAA